MFAFNETHFEDMVNVCSDAIIVVNRNNIIQFVNPAAESLFARAAHDLLNAPFDYPLVVDETTEISIQRKGDMFCVGEMRVAEMAVEDDVGYLVTIRDVTARKSRETHLHYHAAVQASIHDAVIVTDMEFRIQSWNQAAEVIYGWTADEVVGKSIYGLLVTRFESEQDAKRIEADFLNNGSWQGEVTQRHQDGSKIYIQSSVNLFKNEAGEPIGTVAVNRDITNRKQTEQVLRAILSEEHEFQAYLKALHEISIELTELDDLDTFYKRAVELGRERLGFERFALFLYDADSHMALGTYGTDAEGNTSDESQLRLVPNEVGSEQEASGPQVHVSLVEDTELETARVPLNIKGWNATAEIQHGLEKVGWLIADNGIEHKAATKPMLDILGLYAMTVGTLLARKHEQTALRESEARYRLLAENISDVITQVNDQGEFMYLSPSFKTLLGYEPEALVGKSAFDYLYIDDTEPIEQTFQDNLTDYESLPPISYRFRHKDGHPVWVESTRRAIISEETGEVTGFVAASRNITERIQAQEDLRRNAAEIEDLYNNAPCGYHSIDKDGVFVRINDTELEWLGYERDEVIGKLKFTDVVSENTKHVFYDNYLTFKERGWVKDLEFELVRKDGTILHILLNSSAIYDESGNYVQSRSTCYDISDRHAALQALRESEEKFRQLVETMRGGLAMYDEQDIITYANKRFCEQLGYSVEEMVGTSSFDYVDEENAQKIRGQLEERHGLSNTVYELTVRHKDGHPVHLLISSSPLLDSTGNYIGSFAVTTDISVQKQAEEKLRVALGKEKELNELKSRFVSMASHEFRTPLASILVMTDTLTVYRRKLSEEDIDKKLEKIREQISYLKNVMEDVLQLARMQARRIEFNPVRLDLNKLCVSVIDEFEERRDVPHELIYECSADLQDVELDKRLMRQIISNVVSNAIKYTPHGKPVNINVDQNNEILVLKIQDQGIGIPEEDMKHLFEPFHRASNVGTISGTGLGLTITKESVELHDGTISVESQVDVGTTIIIKIPLKRDRSVVHEENSRH